MQAAFSVNGAKGGGRIHGPLDCGTDGGLNGMDRLPVVDRCFSATRLSGAAHCNGAMRGLPVSREPGPAEGYGRGPP